MVEPRQLPRVDILTAGMSRAARVGVTDEEAQKIRKAVDETLAQMRSARWSWWSTWKTLARYVQPRMGRFLPTANQQNRGQRRDQSIVNAVATTSSERFGAGMLSGATSPSRPWFKLKIGDGRGGSDHDAGEWLDEVTARMMHVFAEGNFYNSVGSAYETLGVFGSALVLMYEDYEDVIRFYPSAIGEFFLDVDDRGDVSRIAREFTMTIGAIVSRWGTEVVSESTKTAWQNNQLAQELIVCHVIERNDERIPNFPGPKGMPWREVYWQAGQSSSGVLQARGFHERPFLAPRWHVESNDPYGRSPGMTCLGDVIQIQVVEREKAKAIQKVNNPPMVATANMRNEPASVIPGHITYLPTASDKDAFRPAYQINPNIQHYTDDIARCEARVKAAFYEDLFFAISQMEGVQPRNELELTERKAEKLVMLGPPLQRMHNELLKPAIERTFSVMQRAGLIPPAPQSMHGSALSVEFISDLARAQRAADATSIEQVFAFAGRIAALKPEVLDKLDPDQALDDYAGVISLPTNILVSDEAVAAMRQQRAKQQQAANAMQAGLATAQGAKVLGETDVGGGQNAIDRMMNGPAQ